DGTLGYEGEQKVGAELTGTVTWLPAEGAIIGRGGRLYEVDGSRRATLLFGPRPAWRTLGPGVSNGADVLQLERNLQAMGYLRKGTSVDYHWGSGTTAAVKRFQRAHGLEVDGVLDLGEIVFLPQSLRVTDLPASL